MRVPTCVIALAIVLASSHVAAEPVTVAFGVRVTLADDEGRLLGLNVQAGDLLRGTYTFDSNAKSEVGSAVFGLYTWEGEPYGFSLGNITTDALRIDIHNSASGSTFWVIPIGWKPQGLIPGVFEFGLSSPEPQFPSAALPAGAPDLRMFTSFNRFSMDGRVGDGFDARWYSIGGEVVELAPVPEPATISLVVIGLGGMVLKAHRNAATRRRRDQGEAGQN